MSDTAVDRAMEMMHTKFPELPPKAYEYFKFLARQYGGCGEVYITAYAHYAQAIEGLECKDDLYQIDSQGIQWFKDNPGEFRWENMGNGKIDTVHI